MNDALKALVLSCALAACARVHSADVDAPDAAAGADELADASRSDASQSDASDRDASHTSRIDAGNDASMHDPDPGSRDAAIDDASVSVAEAPGCTAGLGRLAGDYREADGTEHWFRASISAALHVRVPSGPVTQQALPELRVVTAMCERRRYFLWRDADAAIRRDDFRRDGNTLALCTNPKIFSSVGAAQAASAPAAADDGSGCFGGTWLSLTAKETP